MLRKPLSCPAEKQGALFHRGSTMEAKIKNWKKSFYCTLTNKARKMSNSFFFCLPENVFLFVRALPFSALHTCVRTRELVCAESVRCSGPRPFQLVCLTVKLLNQSEY